MIFYALFVTQITNVTNVTRDAILEGEDKLVKNETSQGPFDMRTKENRELLTSLVSSTH